MYRTVTINVLRGDDVVHSIGQTVPYRQYTVQEIDLLAHMHGMEVAGLYGEMDLNVDLYHADAFRLVAVLRKTK